MIRLDKLLAQQGSGSRREVKRLLHAGVVTIDNVPVFDGAQKVDSAIHIVQVAGRTVTQPEHSYLMLNKPAGVVTARSDRWHQTVFDLLGDECRTPSIWTQLHCIGRLDIDTEGLLLVTTDGALTHRITAPKACVPKSYAVRLERAVTEQEQASYAARCAAGVHIAALGREPAADCRSALLQWRTPNECHLTITEGKYHQVKRMIAALGNRVVFLRRIAVGGVLLDESLSPGAYRPLTRAEMAVLLDSA
ncbi:MAG: rRNA pseudouridine synthase, partial [Treponema sp.]|nr:rRNA pseudouridine synthase [Treponema sp.]